jgi:UDP:flavonoid glycosyltransferase YjiC (YdhE family)
MRKAARFRYNFGVVRALFVCQPGVGHFHPMVPSAAACEDEGHDVAFAVSPSFVPVVEAAGFEAVPAGLDWLASAPEQAFPETAAMGVAALAEFLFERIFLGDAAAAMAGDLPGVCEAWGPDMLVHEGTEFGAPLAAEATGLPRATLVTQASWPPTSMAPLVAPAVDGVRADLGLPADPGLERLASCLHLACYPPLFQVSGSPQSWFPDLRPLRPVPYDGPTPPAALDRGDRWVPVGATAQQADIVVGSGGWDTSMAALAAGKPSLVLPQAGDQSFNAFRMEAAGAGIRLLSHAVDPGTVRRAVRELLDEPLYFANAQRLRRSIEAMPGPAELVPVLAALT